MRHPSPESERTPESRTLEAELAQKHWDAWIDTRCRRSRTGHRVKHQNGRERLEVLLADFVPTAERVPSVAGPDVEALRRRLGLN